MKDCEGVEFAWDNCQSMPKHPAQNALESDLKMKVCLCLSFGGLNMAWTTAWTAWTAWRA